MSKPPNSITVHMTAEERALFKQMQIAIANQPMDPISNRSILQLFDTRMDPELREIARSVKEVPLLESQFLTLENRRYESQSRRPSDVLQTGRSAPPITALFLQSFFEEYARRLNAMEILEDHDGASPWLGRQPKASPSTSTNRELLEHELVNRLPFSQEEVLAAWQFLAANRATNGSGPARIGSLVGATAHQLLDKVLGEAAEKRSYERWLASQPVSSVDMMQMMELTSRWNRLPPVDDLRAIVELERASALAGVGSDRSTIQDSKPRRRGHKGKLQWEIVRDKLFALLHAGRLPKSMRDAARVLNEKLSTVRTAVVRTRDLRAHFAMSGSRSPVRRRMKQLQAIPELAKHFETLSPIQMESIEKRVHEMSDEEFDESVQTLEKNPDSVTRWASPLIDEIDEKMDSE